MHQNKLNAEIILESVGNIERTLEFLKRDIIKGIEIEPKEVRTSLYGSVKGGDITEEMIVKNYELRITNYKLSWPSEWQNWKGKGLTIEE